MVVILHTREAGLKTVLQCPSQQNNKNSFTLNEAFTELKLQGATVRWMSSDIVCT